MNVTTKVVPKIMGSANFRTFRCLWMLEELGIEYEHVPSASPQSEQVKKYNPLGKVPVLIEDNEFALYESGAILTYLGDRYDANNNSGNKKLSPPLVPRAGTRERGLYDQTMSVLLTELDAQGLWIHRKHEALGGIFTFIPEAVEHAKKYFSKTNRVLLQQIKNQGPYLLGPAFSGVDIVYIHCLDWSKSIGWNDRWKDDPTLQGYLELCKSRPAYIRTKQIRSNEQSRNKAAADLQNKL
ncbi:glutathione S-transferase, C-terminal domain containing protein [Nitzschia inconspicua]|uniref:Glutathione S-transferase, C-terminal domain containing protein n=1 Tax=Nitzschia inconspicua TaxID=303405 RepID=A0A9K3L5Y3_9STRA|nr:glutathione S-transferase, C-terminal domain containing protein [Nitzschia inconspicua]